MKQCQSRIRIKLPINWVGHSASPTYEMKILYLKYYKCTGDAEYIVVLFFNIDFMPAKGIKILYSWLMHAMGDINIENR